MSDDDSPDNVVSLPRIGSPPPPPVPPPPVLADDQEQRAEGDGVVRISAFDAPAVPHAPPPPDAVPAAFRSDGLDDGPAPADAGPPRAGALSLAAILAIALAAFEGLHTWIQESGPRRAEAAAHQRELELLAAKASADATRHHAEADREHARARRVPSSHEYGRSALGRRSGGPGWAAGGIGPGRAGTGRTGPHSGSAQHRSGTGSGGRPTSGTGRNGAGHGSAGTGSGTGRSGSRSPYNSSGPSRNEGGANRNGPLRDRNGGGRSRNEGGFRRKDGSGSSGGSGTRGPASAGSGSAGAGGSGRRSARQTVADWWGKGKKKPDGTGPGTGPKGSGGKSTPGAADTKAALRNALKTPPGPTFWDKVGDRMEDRWRKRRPSAPAPDGKSPGTSGKGTGKGGSTGNDGWTPPGARTGFRDAVFEAVFGAVNDRWKKRRARWTTDDGPRSRPGPSRGSGGTNSTTNPGSSTGPGPSGAGDHPGYGQARSSPFDADTDPRVTITVEQVDPPGAHAKRWEPTPLAPRRQALPKQGAPALPRAPQRPAGHRPGTTRRKEPIPMPPSPVPASAAGTSVPAATAAPSQGSLAPQHATDINLDKALEALTALTTAGMETHDESAELAKQARKLLSELELMAHDLITTHNVRGARTLAALMVVMESVAQLVKESERTARAALDAAELAEAEEMAMARDYRPVQDATADAGLATPSARIHNEN